MYAMIDLFRADPRPSGGCWCWGEETGVWARRPVRGAANPCAGRGRSARARAVPRAQLRRRCPKVDPRGASCFGLRARARSPGAGPRPSPGLFESAHGGPRSCSTRSGDLAADQRRAKLAARASKSGQRDPAWAACRRAGSTCWFVGRDQPQTCVRWSPNASSARICTSGYNDGLTILPAAASAKLSPRRYRPRSRMRSSHAPPPGLGRPGCPWARGPDANRRARAPQLARATCASSKSAIENSARTVFCTRDVLGLPELELADEVFAPPAGACRQRPSEQRAHRRARARGLVDEMRSRLRPAPHPRRGLRRTPAGATRPAPRPAPLRHPSRFPADAAARGSRRAAPQRKNALERSSRRARSSAPRGPRENRDRKRTRGTRGT